jgi:hypothetical protein
MELFEHLTTVEGAAWSFGIIMVNSLVEQAIFSPMLQMLMVRSS